MSRVHHDDEGRIFLRDVRGDVWRMMIREGAPAPSRHAEFRSASGRTVSAPLDGEVGHDDISDDEIIGLFRRASSGR